MADTRPLIFRSAFLSQLGAFHAAWAAVDQCVDISIGRFLKLPHEQTHLLTSGMMFGRKAKLLADLLGRSDHPRKAEALGALNKIRGEIRRDWLAHSYITSTQETVTFIYRNTSGEFKVNKLTYSVKEFRDHVTGMIEAGTLLESSLEITREEWADFLLAAESAANRDSTSPA